MNALFHHSPQPHVDQTTRTLHARRGGPTDDFVRQLASQNYMGQSSNLLGHFLHF